MSALRQKQTTLVRAKAGFWLPREARSNKSGSIVVKISEEQFHFCELGQASRRLPPTRAVPVHPVGKVPVRGPAPRLDSRADDRVGALSARDSRYRPPDLVSDAESVHRKPDRARGHLPAGHDAVWLLVRSAQHAGRDTRDHLPHAGSLLRGIVADYFSGGRYLERDRAQRRRARRDGGIAACALGDVDEKAAGLEFLVCACPYRKTGFHFSGACAGGNPMLDALLRILGLVRKELLAILKDPRSRFALVGPPILQCLIFGYAATYDLNHVPYVALDQDRSAASRALLAKLDGSGVFDRVANLGRAGDCRRTQFKHGWHRDGLPPNRDQCLQCTMAGGSRRERSAAADGRSCLVQSEP